MIVGCDPGTKTVGLATIRGDVAEAVTITCPAMADSDLRVEWLRDYIERLLAKFAITLFAIEKMRGFGNGADGPLFHAAAAFRTVAKLRGIKVVEIGVSTWKKVACGAGNATKEEVQAVMRLQWGLDLEENAADALGIATAALQTPVPRKAKH